jgi:hypothetical protein
MRSNSLSLASAVALAVAALSSPAAVQAASQFVTAAQPEASANLDFRVEIPAVLYLQVGTGTFQGNNTTIDRVDFQLSALEASNPGGDPVAATATSGDQGDGEVSVRVFGNNGTVTLNSTANTLASGSDSIPWNEIEVTVAAGGPPGNPQTIPHGAFSPDGAIAPQALSTNPGGKVTNLQSTWTYSYANSAQYAPGVYTGRVTYTASMP